MPAVGQDASLCLSVVQALFRAVLHGDDTVEGLEAAPQLQVDFTLDVHEDEAAGEANGHHYQLGPEGPLQHTCGHSNRKTRSTVSPPAGRRMAHDGGVCRAVLTIWLIVLQKRNSP